MFDRQFAKSLFIKPLLFSLSTRDGSSLIYIIHLLHRLLFHDRFSYRFLPHVLG